MMSSSRLVRGAKTRMFAFICLVSVLGAVLFVFHGTQTRLAEVQSEAAQCNQQKESFNAQLQVIYEYKDRLEKSLSKEKQDRKLEKENHDRNQIEAKEKWEKDSIELNNKYEALVQKSKILQAQLEDLKENNDKVVSKLQGDKNALETALADSKKQLEAMEVKSKDDSKDLRIKFLDQQNKLNLCEADLKRHKMDEGPEAESKDHLTKQNYQLESELSLTKSNLALCNDKLSQATKTASSTVKADKAEQPESNVVDVPQFNSLKNLSSTPGVNPDAIGESSSSKPVRDQGEIKNEENHFGLAPKKPTQESVVPLQQPKKLDDNPPPMGQAQIPVPGIPEPNQDSQNKPFVEDNNDLVNINLEDVDDVQRQQEAKAQLQQPQLVNPAIDANRAEEEQDPGANFKQPGRNPEHYHGGDYDKEQADDDGDGGEQIDYDGDKSVKEGKQMLNQAPVKLVESRGVMVNPK